jgi:hypothetical protein
VLDGLLGFLELSSSVLACDTHLWISVQPHPSIYFSFLNFKISSTIKSLLTVVKVNVPAVLPNLICRPTERGGPLVEDL